MKYKFLEHTADAFFRAYGDSFSELLENSAEAMCSVMYELEKVGTVESVKLEVEGETAEELLHNFLEEVLFEIESRGMVFGKFSVKADAENGLASAELFGEKMDAAKHELKTEIKAVTWHSFFVRKEANKWVSQVLVDI